MEVIHAQDMQQYVVLSKLDPGSIPHNPLFRNYAHSYTELVASVHYPVQAAAFHTLNMQPSVILSTLDPENIPQNHPFRNYVHACKPSTVVWLRILDLILHQYWNLQLALDLNHVGHSELPDRALYLAGHPHLFQKQPLPVQLI